MTDKIRIQILPGGIVKVETDKISAPNHLSADRLLRGVEEELGGNTQIERKKESVRMQQKEHCENDLA